ncbi:MAG: FKBP-type peptidyl-prolyl cis-trans isomerase [Sphingomonadaceae bacterium]|nr:FKBP-type peptidyl-prolyl cis-trans isomerase [Sphingomonadaceae bacterium]
MSVTAVPLRPIARSTLVKLWIGIAAMLFGAAALAWSVDSPLTTTESGLRYQTLEPGEGGSHPGRDDLVLIDYEGRLADGTVFDSGERVDNPVAGFIPGFTEALMLMTKGERARFWIPADLAYGDDPPPNSDIPPGATLEFTITLHEFITQEQLMQLQMQMMQQQMMQGGGMPGAAPPGEAPAPTAEGAPPPGM